MVDAPGYPCCYAKQKAWGWTSDKVPERTRSDTELLHPLVLRGNDFHLTAVSDKMPIDMHEESYLSCLRTSVGCPFTCYSNFQATVGAGLPIIATLKHLRETGDKIISIEGIFSGTLSYLFNAFGTDDRSFSTIVSEAKASGFTEPDPRDDLSGMDVARKVCAFTSNP